LSFVQYFSSALLLSFTVGILTQTHNILAFLHVLDFHKQWFFIHQLSFQSFLNGNTFSPSDSITLRQYLLAERNNCWKELGERSAGASSLWSLSDSEL
jgi:hypothetical protein